MNIVIQTRVEKNFQLVFNRFNLDLFKALKPPVVKLEVLRFDGCKKGDRVHLQLTTFGKCQQWESLITSNFKGDYELNFVDEGVLIPPPLKKWTHTHRVQKINELACLIVDDIEYTSGNKFLDVLLYPSLYLMFLFRVPVYKREFA
jgi:ligand-binding SRPBCC domain-containing protein